MAIRLVVRRRSPDEHSTNTYFAAAFEFRHRRRDVCEFDGAETDEPLRIVTGIFGGPVVEPRKHAARSSASSRPNRWIPHLLGAASKPRLMCSGSSSAVLPEPKKPATCIGSIFSQTKNSPSLPS